MAAAGRLAAVTVHGLGTAASLLARTAYVHERQPLHPPGEHQAVSMAETSVPMIGGGVSVMAVSAAALAWRFASGTQPARPTGPPG